MTHLRGCTRVQSGMFSSSVPCYDRSVNICTRGETTITMHTAAEPGIGEIFAAEPAQRRSTSECGEQVHPRVHPQVHPFDQCEAWALPDRGMTVPAMQDGFCPCARCKNARRRIAVADHLML